MATSPTKRKNILLVEDQPEHCELLALNLEPVINFSAERIFKALF
jgi:hypothetical protein